jgi:hypothetical protein
LAATLTLLITLYFVGPGQPGRRGGPLVRFLVTVVVLVALAAAVLAQVRMAAGDPARHIDGLVAVIVAVWLIFSLAFYLMADHRRARSPGCRRGSTGSTSRPSTMLHHRVRRRARDRPAGAGLIWSSCCSTAVFVALAVTMLTTRLRSRRPSPGPAQARSTQRNPE